MYFFGKFSAQGDLWRQHLRQSDLGDEPRGQSQRHREAGEGDFCGETLLPRITGVQLELDIIFFYQRCKKTI